MRESVVLGTIHGELRKLPVVRRRMARKLLSSVLGFYCAICSLMVPAVAAPGPAELVFTREQAANSEEIYVTLFASPGVYSLESQAVINGDWSSETNVSLITTNRADLTIPVIGRTTLFLRAVQLAPAEEVMIQTLGDSFSAIVDCAGPEPFAMSWGWSDGTFSTDYPLASQVFGTKEARVHFVAALAPTTLRKINLGFDAADGGQDTPLDLHPPQQVSSVVFPRPLTNLQVWASSHNPITNALDFRGFNSLEIIEAFQCWNLQHAYVSDLPLLRRVCLEAGKLRQLDLSGNPSLEDVRAAVNLLTNIVLDNGTGSKIWHWCVRDNPQLQTRLQDVMTNFYSLKEFWAWNANQNGHLSFVSTNLISIRAYRNQYTSADLSSHSNLFEVRLQQNELTNVVLKGNKTLWAVELQSNHLPTDGLNNLLAELDESAPALDLVNISDNAGMVSGAGLIHYTNLVSRGVTVYLDLPGDPLPPAPPPPATNPPSSSGAGITFVTTSRNPTIEIRTSDVPDTIVWHWGDGATTSNALVVNHDFGIAGIFTNFVEVTPPELVTYFGAPRHSPAQGIRSVYDADKFPNLNYLYLFREDLINLSIAGCASLRQLHLASTSVSVETCDQWFIDLDAAVQEPVSNADFWYPADRRSPASDAAWQSLVTKGFSMYPY